MDTPFQNVADLATQAARRFGQNESLRHAGEPLSFVELDRSIDTFSDALSTFDLPRYSRIAIYLNKQTEFVIAALGTCRYGGVFVPVNPVLKAAQVGYILQDCGVQLLVTNKARFQALSNVIGDCSSLATVVLVDDESSGSDKANEETNVVSWATLMSSGGGRRYGSVANDMAAILYTSGSTGKPKGVVLSHSNLVIGAQSVATYIENSPDDRILAALPFSFDAGLSQLTTALYSGACVVLHDFFLPRDVIKVIEKEGITGITGVPPLWMQLAELEWPEGTGDGLRYFANTGGKMPKETLARLRQIFPNAAPFLMYGLTESFRSTYLPPEQIDKRPESIGKAIPNAEVLVVNSDGQLCGPNEEGELVHRGPLVSLGYWNDKPRTDERFRPAPGQPDELPTPELAVWSGDTVRTDDEGYLYFVGRKDEMIKTSGYRVSPTEIEEIAYDSGLAAEAIALGPKHPKLGQAIVLVARAPDDGELETDSLLAEYRRLLPGYMVPLDIVWRDDLPRNANGKIDRKQLGGEFENHFQSKQ